MNSTTGTNVVTTTAGTVVLVKEEEEDVVDDQVDDCDQSHCTVESSDTNECIELFLGHKLSLDDMRNELLDWDCCNNDDHSPVDDSNNSDCIDVAERHQHDICVMMMMDKHTTTGTPTTTTERTEYRMNNADESQLPLVLDHQHHQLWFRYAYRCNNDNNNNNSNSNAQQQQEQQHCVQIVYDPERYYYSVVAIQNIPKGTILYTERPIIATQLPSFPSDWKDNKRRRRRSGIKSSSHIITNQRSISQQQVQPQLEFQSQGRDDCVTTVISQHCSNDRHTTSVVATTTTTIGTAAGCNNNENKHDEEKCNFCYKVRACQYCYQSLEPLSSCYNCCNSTTATGNNNNNDDDGNRPLLPLPHLYPILDFHFLDDQTTTETTATTNEWLYRVDQYDRVQCTKCQSYFCSRQCYHQFQHQYGSCCSLIEPLHHVVMTKPHNPKDMMMNCTTENNVPDVNDKGMEDNNKSHIDNGTSNMYAATNEDEDCDDDDDDDDRFVEAMQQSAIALAIRMFVATLQSYRRTTTTTTMFDTKYTTSSLMDNHIPTSSTLESVSLIQFIVNGLCGTETDLQPLELGIPCRLTNEIDVTVPGSESPSVVVQYTVEPIYDVLVKVYSITTAEQECTFTLSYFMSLCSKAARNGFGTRPQSPFQSYYAGLVRTSLYRGSDQHVKLQNQVANALFGRTGSSSCTDAMMKQKSLFQRGMDRRIDEYVCPEVVALYGLTSRMNHSCTPNTEVRSQQYIDCTIDVVAIQDIQRGDEITISYIYGGSGGRCEKETGGTGKSHLSHQRRRRELLAKYLFHCDCSLCKR